MGTNDTKPRAAAVYTRISSDQDGSGAGVARQREDCLTLAERLGWQVAEVYEDNDISAYSGKRRPAFERMLEDLGTGARDAVIVYHVDRLTRRPIELERFLASVDAAGVRFVRFVVGDSDVMTGDGLMVVRILAAMAANESATKARRVTRKLQANAAQGLPSGGALRPFGYEIDKVTVREDEAAVIRDIVARFLAGESARSLAAWLTAQGVSTVQGGPWRTPTLRSILASGRIAGMREYHGEVVAQATWPAIITPADRERVLAAMKNRANTHARSPRTYLLSSLLRCGRCDTRMYAAAKKGYRRYVCLSGPDHGGCGSTVVTAEPTEEYISDMVLLRLGSPEFAATLSGKAATDPTVAVTAKALSDDRARLSELADAFGQGAFTMAEWMTARRPIEARIADAERRVARATRTDALTGLPGNAATLRAEWPTLALTRQHAIIAAVLDHAKINACAQRGGRFNSDRIAPVWRL